MAIPAELTSAVRDALGINASYEATIIPAAIRRAITRLLRDYNFPKSLRETDLPTVVDANAYTLPAGFKKEHGVVLYNPDDDTWGNWLKKREGLMLPTGLGYPSYYWLQGTQLFHDTKLSLAFDPCVLRLYWQSMQAEANEDWFCADFYDILFHYTVYREAAVRRKPEVMQAFAPLQQEDRQSLAIYANELEFDNLDMVQREVGYPAGPRYPTDAVYVS